MACMFCTRCGGCELGRLGMSSEGTCPMCGTQVPDDAAKCPNCGAPAAPKPPSAPPQ